MTPTPFPKPRGVCLNLGKRVSACSLGAVFPYTSSLGTDSVFTLRQWCHMAECLSQFAFASLNGSVSMKQLYSRTFCCLMLTTCLSVTLKLPAAALKNSTSHHSKKINKTKDVGITRRLINSTVALIEMRYGTVCFLSLITFLNRWKFHWNIRIAVVEKLTQASLVFRHSVCTSFLVTSHGLHREAGLWIEW